MSIVDDLDRIIFGKQVTPEKLLYFKTAGEILSFATAIQFKKQSTKRQTVEVEDGVETNCPTKQFTGINLDDDSKHWKTDAHVRNESMHCRVTRE